MKRTDNAQVREHSRKWQMDEIKEYRPNRVFRLALVLLCAVLVSAWMTSGLLARYTSGGAGSDEARVASFDVTADMMNFETKFPVQLMPGKSVTCSFTITNSSETAVNMQAVLETEGNLPLKIEYQKGNTDADNWVCLAENIQNVGEGSCKFSDAMAAGNKEKQTYQIQVSWPEETNGYQYANGVEAVNLFVTASQID